VTTAEQSAEHLEPRPAGPPGAGHGRKFHRAWAVAAITFFALIATAAFRSSTGALIEPIELQFGWSRSTTSLAITVNLVLYGLTAPFAAALMERFGIRRMVALALTLVALGCLATTVMASSWQLVLAWGLAIGIGTGSMALVFGAIIAERWFVTNRGLVTGIFSAASSTGQLVFLPVLAALIDRHGWRTAVFVVAAFSLLLVPFVMWLLADSPASVGQVPYGAGPDWRPPVTARRNPGRAAIGRVEVLNASGVPGLARRGTEVLRDGGYDVVSFGNAPGFAPDSSLVLDRVGRMELARSVADAVQIPRVYARPDSNVYVDVTVVLGRDWAAENADDPAAEAEAEP